MAITMPASSASQQRQRSVWSAVALLCTMVVPAHAADWNFTPFISVQELYTDNLTLVPDDADKEDSFITTIAPGFSLNRRSAKGQYNLNYSLRYNDYSSDEADDFSSHNLVASSTTELYDDHLFLDLDANASQALIDNRSASAGDSIFNNDAYTDRFTYAISPFWRQDIGDDLTLGLTASYADIIYSEDAVDDSDGFKFSGFIDYKTDSKHRDFHWAIDAKNAQANGEDGNENQTDTYRLSAGYRFGPKLDTTLSYGYVDNHIETDNDDISADTFWGAEIEWSPTKRTNLIASYDSKSTNEGQGIKFDHRHRNYYWSITYDKRFTDTFFQTLELLDSKVLVCPRDFLSLSDCEAKSAQEVDFSNEVIINVDPSTLLNFSIANARFVEETLANDFTYYNGKSSYGIRLSANQREYETGTLPDEDIFSVTLSWRINLSSRTNTAIRYNWSQIEPDGLSDDQLHLVSWNITRIIADATTFSTGLNYSERVTDDAAREYKEHSIQASLTKRF